MEFSLSDLREIPLWWGETRVKTNRILTIEKYHLLERFRSSSSCIDLGCRHGRIENHYNMYLPWQTMRYIICTGDVSLKTNRKIFLQHTYTLDKCSRKHEFTYKLNAGLTLFFSSLFRTIVFSPAFVMYSRLYNLILYSLLWLLLLLLWVIRANNIRFKTQNPTKFVRDKLYIDIYLLRVFFICAVRVEIVNIFLRRNQIVIYHKTNITKKVMKK